MAVGERIAPVMGAGVLLTPAPITSTCGFPGAPFPTNQPSGHTTLDLGAGNACCKSASVALSRARQTHPPREHFLRDPIDQRRVEW